MYRLPPVQPHECKAEANTVPYHICLSDSNFKKQHTYYIMDNWLKEYVDFLATEQAVYVLQQNYT